MDEVENPQAVAEIAPPETNPQETPVQVEASQSSEQERNWRDIRRRNAELEKKLKMQEEMLQAVIPRMAQQPPPPQVVDELDNVSDDDYIPAGKVKKLIKKAEERADKIAHDAVNKVLHEREKSQFAEKLRSKYNDFDDVVNPETIELLEQQEPELAKSIAASGDPYSMGLQSYKLIKSMGIAEKVPQNRRTKEVEKKIEQNSKTVQTPQAYDKRPMAETFRLTEKHKQDLYQEMSKFASLAGSAPPI